VINNNFEIREQEINKVPKNVVLVVERFSKKRGRKIKLFEVIGCYWNFLRGYCELLEELFQ